ncbi:class molecular chaperone with c-terminal zn finger domain protein [Leptolyngbya sp. Heron Island J]|uniref:IMS domain-containing protein n=1 Tax=Leptolyngbya sp. Heron Island J TaxID=1385935 RepID=UPI0003B9D97B|nr:IMS domain-containing protein [Leptolyngbya sp. Heron Island J]ESA32649.1 class molecular chaperone with c-terminal zn finger domain protein [Leptolyngbya sp. Heron Island J]
MQIPLDYYRILGLPMQATAEQLEQAHRDRTLQLPRREYSEFAIQSRKQLIDAAYVALKDSGTRQAYDAQLLATRSEPVAIEIYEQQLIGALLILLELGEYELVIRLGRPYLSSGSGELEGNAKDALADVVLTIGLACLELGREQWQQHQYENAAESLETGQELMVRENVFPEMQAEIQADLDKLKPYRILELLARPLADKAARQQGIALLKSMLAARGGIDGANDDSSGLSVEDFLRFVQQLRSYLTSAEQQDIFEAEAQRPSSVGVYLSVYALLARGFAKHQPNLVRQAKQRLALLTERQDVYLEQAVCAVLLGQTEEATYALERSHENEPISFIREHSAGAPDLLPGLCLYTERWLQQDVFPFFRDLDQSNVTLKDYFANEQVQAYLEAMPPEDTVAAGRLGMAGYSSSTSYGSSDYGSSDYSSSDYGRSTFGAGQAVGLGAAATVGVGSARPSAYTAEEVSNLSPEGQLDNELSASVGADEPMVKSRRRSSSPKWGRLALVLLLGLLGLGLLGFILTQLFSLFGGLFGGPQLQGDPPDIDVARPAIELPTEDVQPTASDDVQVIAEEAIQTWYQAKAEAMGPQWNVDALSDILLEPTLSEWVAKVESNQREGVHLEYEQTIQNLTAEAIGDDQLQVVADVSEIGNAYQFGDYNGAFSYEDELTVEYNLRKQDDQWMIESFAVQ